MDVLTIEQLTPAAQTRLIATGFDTELPHHNSLPGGGTGTIEVCHVRLDVPVPVPVDHVATITDAQKLGVQAGVIGHGSGWGPTPT